MPSKLPSGYSHFSLRHGRREVDDSAPGVWVFFVHETEKLDKNWIATFMLQLSTEITVQIARWYFFQGCAKGTKQPESAAALLVCYTTSLSGYTVPRIWNRKYHQGRRNKEIVRNRRHQRPIWISHIPTAWGAIKPGWRFQRCCCSGSNLPRWPSQFTDNNVILMDGLEPGMTRVKNLQKILYV